MKLETIQGNGCTISVLGVIKGLKTEVDRVQSAFDLTGPDIVAVSISKEELEGLRNLPDDYVPDLSRYEQIYAEGLSRFGEVAAPPPCYVATLELADHRGIRLVPVDLDEQSYSDLYCAAVPGTTLFRHSTRTWILKRRRFSDEGAEEFVLKWDKVVNDLEGFRAIEDKRALAMAKGVLALCGDSKKVLAVIELERAKDVLELIKSKMRRMPSAEKD
jgi:hypothetical protein